MKQAQTHPIPSDLDDNDDTSSKPTQNNNKHPNTRNKHATPRKPAPAIGGPLSPPSAYLQHSTYALAILRGWPGDLCLVAKSKRVRVSIDLALDRRRLSLFGRHFWRQRCACHCCEKHFSSTINRNLGWLRLLGVLCLSDRLRGLKWFFFVLMIGGEMNGRRWVLSWGNRMKIHAHYKLIS